MAKILWVQHGPTSITRLVVAEKPATGYRLEFFDMEQGSVVVPLLGRHLTDIGKAVMAFRAELAARQAAEPEPDENAEEETPA